ncbi:MAG: cyclopropane fatty acyl phospholipid synthase [Nanoarchaeota archaeon]|nr:cyclopropane fatty acyl phospholipid synthase [Nanoarchaeota archaeon]
MGKNNKLKKTVQELFAHADVEINGNRSWDIQVHNPKFYARVLAEQSLGLGESYMDGWWDCERLDQFSYKVLSSGLREKSKDPNLIWRVLKSKLINMQSKLRSKIVGEKHYDLGNDLFISMLDKRMTYSCGYWKDAKNLDAAQGAKLDLICKKLGLKKGDKILDIGCGWGNFLKYAAEKYGIKGVGITISKEQVKLAKELCKGLDVEIRLQDYRDIEEKFDHIVSIGMIEHVGYKNYETFMKKVKSLLKDDGLFLLHTIGNKGWIRGVDPWLLKYIFPNSMIPSAKQITSAAEGLFILQDLQNFGIYYDKTLMAWHANFTKNWDKLKNRYDERFHRMWDYFLLSSAGNFRAFQLELWQIVYSKNGLKEVYQAVR